MYFYFMKYKEVYQNVEMQSDKLIFKNVYAGFMICKNQAPLSKFKEVSRSYRIAVDFAMCNLSATNQVIKYNIETCEGLVVLYLIISNHNRLVQSHHEHENN